MCCCASAPRARWPPQGSDALFGVLDLDYDLREDTGWPSLKDYLFEGVLPPSHVGAEDAIVIGTFADIGDSAFFGRYVDTLTIEPVGTFWPVTCGTMVGFSLDNGLLATPLTFRLVAYFETRECEWRLC